MFDLQPLQIRPPLTEPKIRKTLEIPFPESQNQNTLFDPQHGTHLNGHFGAFNSP